MSYVSEGRLSREEEANLREEAERVPLLEAQLEALRNSMIEFHAEACARALKAESTKAKAAINSWRKTINPGASSGAVEQVGKASGEEDDHGTTATEEGESEIFDGGIGGHMKQVMNNY